MVVEPVEELELIKTQQHLCYRRPHIFPCHICGKARLASVASVASSLASSLRRIGGLVSLFKSSESKP